MNNSPKFGFAIEYVTDIEASTRFYADVVGLPIERTSPTFVQFQNFAIANDESMDGKKQLELFWLVDDAEAVYAELSRKASVSLPLKQLPFGKVFGINDLDGQPRYFVQLVANRPSQSVASAAAGRAS